MVTFPSPRAVTDGPLYCWFGYYDMPCWDAAGRRIVCLGVDFQARPPTGDDVALVMITDLETGQIKPLTETRAFNWQQGAMMHWLPTDPDRLLILNDRVDGRFVSVIVDAETGERNVLGRATSDVGLGGRYALGLNFARIAATRPGYGYAGLADPYGDELVPGGDGVHVIDLSTGESNLAVSMRQVYDRLAALGKETTRVSDGAKMWFNHTLLNPNETRFAFLVRWPVGGRPGWRTAMFSSAVDGSGLRCVLSDGMVSHFDWRDDRHILAWTRIRRHGDDGVSLDAFYLIDDETGEYEVIGRDLLTVDGHCSYSHNGRWILTDTYPDPVTYEGTLKIYVPVEDREVIVGKYLSPPPFVGEIRCDLHPRWSRDDRAICFDSVHEGRRRVYIVDVPLSF